MTVKELRIEAKELGIKGYSRMTKAELESSIYVENLMIDARERAVQSSMIEKLNDARIVADTIEELETVKGRCEKALFNSATDNIYFELKSIIDRCNERISNIKYEAEYDNIIPKIEAIAEKAGYTVIVSGMRHETVYIIYTTLKDKNGGTHEIEAFTIEDYEQKLNDLRSNDGANTETMDLSSKIASEILENNGGTYYSNGDKLEVTGGYMVSVPGHEVVCPVQDFTGSAIRDYLRRASTRSQLAKGGLLGAWVDGGMVYLDISEWMPHRMEALEVGRLRGQKAIFDISEMESIYL